MKLEMIQQLANALRVTPNPRDWFDDPIGGAGSFHDWYTWNIGTDPLASGGNPYAGQKTAVIQTDKRLGMALFLETTAGANQVLEWVRAYQIYPVADSSGTDGWNLFAGPLFFSMRMNRSNPAGSDTGEKYQGISLGDPWLINTPWQTNFGGSACQARIGLHWNYTASKYQLQIYVQDSFAPTLVDLTIQPGFTVDQITAEMAILWVPPIIVPDVGHRYSRIVCMINGQTCLDLFDHARGNLIGEVGSVYGPGIYFTHGSNASSKASEAGYYTGRFWQPLPL